MRKKDPKRARVRRITIDERLDKDLVKIGVASLLPGHTNLSEDALDSWSEEKVRLIRPSTFLRTFGLRKGDPLLKTLTEELTPQPEEKDIKGALWRSIEEGQVFLSGELEVRGSDRKAPACILVCHGAHSVVRIDRIPAIKKKHKGFYSAALKEGS